MIAEGSSKLSSVPSGGGAVASSGGAAAGGGAPAAAAEKEEEKKEEEKVRGLPPTVDLASIGNTYLVLFVHYRRNPTTTWVSVSSIKCAYNCVLYTASYAVMLCVTYNETDVHNSSICLYV